MTLADRAGGAATATQIIDMHTHLPSESSPEWDSWHRERVLERMDELQVSHAVVMTLDGLAYDPLRGNEIVADACSGTAGRLIPLGSVDPRRPDAAEEVRRCRDRGFRGLKLHPWMQGFSPLAPYMTPVAEAAVDCGLPIIVHDGTPPYASPLQIAQLAVRFPELVVVLAHGGLFDMWEDAAAAARRYPNVHITMCGSAPPAVFRQLIAMVPPAKLSLGTDSGFGDPELALHRRNVQTLLLSEVAARSQSDAVAIARGNAAALLGVPC